MTAARRWFESESAGAPPVLLARAASYLHGRAESQDAAADLALAAADALAATLAHGGGRAAALDLLAADALVTLALKARAADDPSGLGAFAAELRATGPGAR